MATEFDFKKRLGAGHFGEVWHAVDKGLNAECALKCIPPDKVINKANFYQEAQVLKAAEHPNIVRVTETGELMDNRIYVVMEYLPQGSIADEAQGSFIPLSKAKRVMVDVLRGLAHAHSQGIVHRDIKPGNILIGNTGEGKLSDFGLALPDLKTLDMSAIKRYQYVLHLAPEVTSFELYTPLADIYACGITLYRLVNGDDFLPNVPPHMARRMAQRGEFPDRGHYRGFIPASLREVINTAMSVDPIDRFQSADEMRRALEGVQIAADWDEFSLNAGKRWVGTSGGRNVEIELTQQKDGTWAVTVRKAAVGKSLRTDGTLSRAGLSKAQGTQTANRLLQRFVNGRA